MSACARCGKGLGLAERNTVFWNNQLKEGYIKASFGMLFECRERKEYLELKGKKICANCCREVYDENKPITIEKSNDGKIENIPVQSPFNAMNDAEYTSCLSGLGLLDSEKIQLQYVCSRQTTRITGVFAPNYKTDVKKGLLVFSNQNLIFMQQDGFFSNNYSQALRVPLENISGMTVGGTLVKHLVIRMGTSGYSEHFTAFRENSGIVQMEAVKKSIEQALKEAREEKHQNISQIQIILDFSSLKDVMAKGGLVMTTYKCPNCNGMVKLPKEGKVLMCEYCGTPIKPVDIFEKIKSLIQ
jgi:hypothetical protein